MVFIVGKCRLDEIIRSRGMTQAEFAEKIGKKKQQINAYCNNDSVMSVQTMKNIAYHLNVPMEKLYDFIWIEQ